ncbi:DUF541 domain-containing protein [Candidatus Parcubacteria bacterium]|nr:MAG: DUF541 domain-containing protein [Candidatus Parcubacteria bacterium]
MRLWMLSLFLLGALAGTCPIVKADEVAATGTLVSLSSTAETWVPNDEMIVHFRIEATGKDVTYLREKVNRISTNIHKRLAQEHGVTLETSDRRLEPVLEYDAPKRRQVRTGWRMVQEERISTSNLKSVPVWLDSIEQLGARLTGLNYRISPSARRQAEQRLELDAVRSFRRKAAALADALDAPSFRIRRLNTKERLPAPIFRQAAPMKASATEIASLPSLIPGKRRLSITVSGEIELPPHSFQVN